MEKFKNLLNQQVVKLFLVVWPPLGEENEADIDISFGFVFQQQMDRLCIISIDKDDMWTPYIRFESIPKNVYPWAAFASRMNGWMKSEEESILETEYYEVTEAELFKDIVLSKIQMIELIRVKNNAEPFGIKIIFENDYILLTPISDGSTVETSKFNKNNNILNFEIIGALEIEKLIFIH